jgi:hypothetical protein
MFSDTCRLGADTTTVRHGARSQAPQEATYCPLAASPGTPAKKFLFALLALKYVSPGLGRLRERPTLFPEGGSMKSKKLLARNTRFGMLLVLPLLLAIVMTSPLRSSAAGNGTDKFGPFAMTATDGSSCGGNWAMDTFQRTWSVHDNGDGTFLVRREEKNGTFSAFAGLSPGACSTVLTMVQR